MYALYRLSFRLIDVLRGIRSVALYQHLKREQFLPAAELAQLQRMAPVLPPLCNLCTAAAVVASCKFQEKAKALNRGRTEKREVWESDIASL